MNTQPITTQPAVEVNQGDWYRIDAGSAAQWQNVVTSHKELAEAISDALALCEALRSKAQAEVQA